MTWTPVVPEVEHEFPESAVPYTHILDRTCPCDPDVAIVGGVALISHQAILDALTQHGYTCGWCSWGRDQVASLEAYHWHVEQTGHRGERPVAQRPPYVMRVGAVHAKEVP